MSVFHSTISSLICSLLFIVLVACSGASEAQPFVNMGLILEDQGDLESAISNYSEAIELDGFYIPAYRQRAKLYLKMGRADLAVNDYSRIILLVGAESSLLAGRGEAHTTAGSFDLAIADLNEAIIKDRFNAKAYFLRAVALAANGDHSPAISNLKIYNELSPDNPHAYYLLGDLYREISQIDLTPRPDTACRRGTACRSAVYNFEQVVKIDPDYPGVYLKLGVAQRNNSSINLSLESLNQALEIDPDDIDVYMERGRTYLANQQPMEGLADFKKVISMAPDEPLAHYGIGWAYLDLGRPLPAIGDFTQAIELAPRDSGKYTSLGIAYMDAGWYRKAVSEFDKSLNISPGDPEVLVMRGESLYRVGDLRLAVDNFTKALAVDPESQAFYKRKKRNSLDRTTYYLRGWSYVEMGDLQSASKDFDEARKGDHLGAEDPIDKGSVFKSLGLLGNSLPPLRGCGGTLDCNLALRQAFNELGLNSSSTSANVQIGDVLFRLGLHDIAEEFFETALDLEPSNPTTSLAIGNVYLFGREFGKAVRNLEYPVSRRPDDPKTLLAFGVANRWLGQWDRRGIWYEECRRGPACSNAIKTLNLLVDLVPDRPIPYIERAAVFRNLGRPDLSVFDLNAAILLDPENAWTFIDRGNSYMRLGMYEKALQDFGEATRRDRYLGPAFGYRALAQIMIHGDFSADRDAIRAVSLGVDDTLLFTMMKTLRQER